MQLVGCNAATNHARLHRHGARALGAEVLAEVESHHNFAWQEEHGGEGLVVHRDTGDSGGPPDAGTVRSTTGRSMTVERGPQAIHTTTDLLRSYARLLRHLSGAEAVSLYLPASPDIGDRPLLIHCSGRPAVPELGAGAAADELLLAAAAGLAATPGSPVASRAPGGRLIPVPGARRHGDPAGRRRKTDRGRPPADAPPLWIGLRLEDESAVEDQQPWRRALAHGVVLAGYCRRVDAVLRDPVTELPGRADFQAALRREVASALDAGRPLALLFANPDDFSLVNERFGFDAGDAVVRQVAGRLRRALRRSHPLHRYGGVVFTAVLPGTSRADAVAVAEKLHAELTEGAYLDGALRLGFSFGLATLEAAASERPAGRDADDATWAMIRRADRALNQAKLSSSGRVVAWRPGSGDEVVVQRDRLSGIFTADLARDYRKMLLLWDTVEIMTAAPDPGELMARALERLTATFKPQRAGLLRWEGSGEPALPAGHGGRGNGCRRGGELILGDAERALVERARTTPIWECARDVQIVVLTAVRRTTFGRKRCRGPLRS